MGPGPGWDQDQEDLDGTRTWMGPGPGSILREALTFCHVSCEAASVSRNAPVQTQRQRDSERSSSRKPALRLLLLRLQRRLRGKWRRRQPQICSFIRSRSWNFKLNLLKVALSGGDAGLEVVDSGVEAGSPHNQGRGDGGPGLRAGLGSVQASTDLRGSSGF